MATNVLVNMMQLVVTVNLQKDDLRVLPIVLIIVVAPHASKFIRHLFRDAR